MSDKWRLIQFPPDRDMPVLLFFANLQWKNADGSIAAELPHFRNERVEVGFYHDGVWRENGTGHDVFEDWRGDWIPTHWMPLPSTSHLKEPNT